MVIRILRVDESNTALEIAWTAHKLFLKSGALNKGKFKLEMCELPVMNNFDMSKAK